ncbi:hypothetical protein HXX76_008536 [Chlamydomonas incerta]|uniref:Uncharacterized protein n=1 Tax=Chlamydomonas incerta TaxID=51695 RepID=A0A835ST01_CHLIN|nr:hypothetical protein HXX76_008536 [Chlamydomonas incerta]|eukprot:KAG2432802.1 hypothetical protein HXX76_008536 [Chlamydomonas incerta]
MSIEPQLRAMDAIGRERAAADFNVRGPRPDWQDSRPHVPHREPLVASEYNPRLDPSLNRGYVKPRPGGSGLNGAARVSVPSPGAGGVPLSDMHGTMGGERRAWGSNNPAAINFAAGGGTAAITSSSGNFGGAFGTGGGGGRMAPAPLSPFSADIAELRGARRLRQYLKHGPGGVSSESGLELLTDHADDWGQLRQHQQQQRYVQEAAWADKYGLPPPQPPGAAATTAAAAAAGAPAAAGAGPAPFAGPSSAPVVYVAGATPPSALTPAAARAAKAAGGPWMLPSTAAAMAAAAAASPQPGAGGPRSRAGSEAATKPAPERIVLVQFPAKSGSAAAAAGAADLSEDDGEVGSPSSPAARQNRRANSLIVGGSRSAAAAGGGVASGPNSGSGAMAGGAGSALLPPALSALTAAQAAGLRGGSSTAPGGTVGALVPTAQPGGSSFAAGRPGPLRGAIAAAAAAAAAAPGGSRSASGGYSGNGAAGEPPSPLLPPTGSAALTTAAAAAAAAAGFVPGVERVHTTYALPSHALTTGADKLDSRALATAAQLIEVVEVVQAPRLAGGPGAGVGGPRMPRLSQHADGPMGRPLAASSSGASPSIAAAGGGGGGGYGYGYGGTFGAGGYGSAFAGVQVRTRRHSTSEALGAPLVGGLFGRSPVLVASTSGAVGAEGSELLAAYGEGPDGEPMTPHDGDGLGGGGFMDDEAAEDRDSGGGRGGGGGGGAHEAALHRFRAAAGAVVAAARWRQVAGVGTQVTPGSFSRVAEMATDTAAAVKPLGLVPALATSRTQVVVTAAAASASASAAAAAAAASPSVSGSAVTRRLRMQAAAQLQHHHHNSWPAAGEGGSESTSLNATSATGASGNSGNSGNSGPGSDGRLRPSAANSLRGSLTATVGASPVPASPQRQAQLSSDRPSPGTSSAALLRAVVGGAGTAGAAGTAAGGGVASASAVSMGIIHEGEEAASEDEGAGTGSAKRRSEPGGIRSAASPLPPASPLLLGALPPRPSPQAALRSHSMHTFGSLVGGGSPAAAAGAKLGTLSPVVGAGAGSLLPSGARRTPRASEPSGSPLPPAAAAAAAAADGGLLATEFSGLSLPLAAGAGLAASPLVGQGAGGGTGVLHRLLGEQQRLTMQLPGTSGYRRGVVVGSGGEAAGASQPSDAVDNGGGVGPAEPGAEVPGAAQPVVLPAMEAEAAAVPPGGADGLVAEEAAEAEASLVADASMTSVASGLRQGQGQAQGTAKRHSWGGSLIAQRSAGNLSVRSGGGAGSGGGAAAAGPGGSDGGAGPRPPRRVTSRALLAPDPLNGTAPSVAAAAVAPSEEESSSATFGGAVAASNAEASGTAAPAPAAAPTPTTAAAAAAAAAFAPQPPQPQVQEAAASSPRAGGTGSRPSRLVVEVPSAAPQLQVPQPPTAERSQSSSGATSSPRPPASPRNPQPASPRPSLGALAAQQMAVATAAETTAEAEALGQHHRPVRPPSALLVPAPPQRPASPRSGSGSGYWSPGSRSVSGASATAASTSSLGTGGAAGSSTTASGSSSLSRGFSGRALLRPSANSPSASMPGEGAEASTVLPAAAPGPLSLTSTVSSSGEAPSSLSQSLAAVPSMQRVLAPSPLSVSGAAPEAGGGGGGGSAGSTPAAKASQGPGPLGDGDAGGVEASAVGLGGGGGGDEAEPQAMLGWSKAARPESARSGATTRRVY